MAIDVTAVTAAVRSVLEAQGISVISDKANMVPVGVSNRHIHLSTADVETLFGKGYELQPMKELSQPGQFACKEQLTIIGPSMRAIEKVRVLGPVRKATQVEISRTDSYTLKVKAPVRESGKIEGSAGLTIVGPKGVVHIDQGCIIANRHIHMSPADGEAFGVKDGEYVNVEVDNGERRTKWYDVQVRVSPDFRLEMHVDTDDANAVGLPCGSMVRVVKD
ncbi:MAG: phosphate propanoyltransferase [Clostridia bacterium]|nr:phosphate propanoyltransferase [Clostridia bacterium]